MSAAEVTVPPRLLAGSVYIDASVYRSLHFDWDGRWLKALSDLVGRGLLRLVTTEVNKREVSTLLRESCLEASKLARSSSVALRQLGLSAAAETLADEDACVKKLVDTFDAWLKKNGAWSCHFDPSVQELLDDYFSGKPPFGNGRKKHEFPDAIVARQLRSWCEATKQKVYVISQDGDLKDCCSAGGPLIHAATIAEIVSHATVTVTVHNAVAAFVKDNNIVYEQLRDQVPYLRVGVGEGYIGPARVKVEVRNTELDDAFIEDVTVFDFDGTTMTCEVPFYAALRLHVDVDQDAVQYGEDDWDPGYHHRMFITIHQPLSATVTANLISAEPVEIEINSVSLDDRSIEVNWHDIEDELW
ncbi:PIN domain-containing protein [Acidiphilium iwatense]|uniref:PIN domain-containing protein n=1 Tax=Acidiphilium iwatense TaxID=768198 RepID=A0ABS9E4A5_9PROT|nr:PIN domain-containing protein [Acidiphilium iwatense]MCF3948865.1 PIN domain-containing protein [Acidiphilium iwatense]